ncbi:MAG: ABC-ATPase domain-containing protein [Myxococcota bacterium]
MRGLSELADTLRRLDGGGYGGYRQIRGEWGDDQLRVAIDAVQGDPFAAPSRVRVVLAQTTHQLPESLRDEPVRRIGLSDFVLRQFAAAVRGASRRAGSGRSGELTVDAGDAEILARAGCDFVGGALELRLRVGLPAKGRRILGREAARILTEALPDAARRVLWSELPQAECRAHVDMAEDHAHVQAQLGDRGLVAFVREGSILPRQSGVSSQPLAGAVAFRTPDEMRVELSTLHHGPVVGMGIPAGVTLITGGGFHGKTTLLDAISAGVTPHIPGDGREWVVTAPDVVKLRSEDGRSVAGVDLRAFIRDLPQGKATEAFCTQDASGSTSLAAAILEALELGATSVLLDEDTSATNLLIRDARMQTLVARETITPLIDRVRGLADTASTILVVGGSGDYLEVADRVLLLEDYVPHDVTDRAAAVVAEHPTRRAATAPPPIEARAPRRPDIASMDPRRGRKTRVRARGLRELSFGEDVIDLSALEQLVDDSQARAIGVLLEWIAAHGEDGATVGELADQAIAAARSAGLYALGRIPELAAVRRYELAGAINRLRSLRLL